MVQQQGPCFATFPSGFAKSAKPTEALHAPSTEKNEAQAAHHMQKKHPKPTMIREANVDKYRITFEAHKLVTAVFGKLKDETCEQPVRGHVLPGLHPRSLSARPLKVTIPKGEDHLQTIIFQGRADKGGSFVLQSTK